MDQFKHSPLGQLARIRNVTTRRESSWDRTGGNKDFIVVQPGETATLANIEGAGVINHIWCTHACTQEHYLRRLLLQMRWDDAKDLSVNVPLGDFFGVGHAQTVNFSALPLQMSPADGKSFNCWFPMPFASRAELLLVNECDVPVTFYYYIDYELHDAIPDDMGRFHAQWHRQNPADGASAQQQTELIKQAPAQLADMSAALADAPTDVIDNLAVQFGGKNVGGEGNYVLLDAEGCGHYVGCNVAIHNLRPTPESGWPEDLPWPLDTEAQKQLNIEQKMAYLAAFNWYGEGDDMIFIDGEQWPPSLHGTGTEDYFNTAYCPAEQFDAPYHGMTLPGGPNWSGKSAYYRFHIEDPIHFRKSIKVTMEHGHNNNRSDDWSSTAYWYQTEPHKPLPAMRPVSDRLPLPDTDLTQD
jgi:hypothetical protein